MGHAKRERREVLRRGYKSISRAICLDHIDDSVLRRSLQERLSVRRCSYCSSAGTDDEPVAAPMDDFMELFMIGVQFHYAPAAQESMPWEEGELAPHVLDASEVATNVFNEVAHERDFAVLRDIQHSLVVDAWTEKKWQWDSPAHRLTYTWDAFKELVKYGSRFLFMNSQKQDPDDLDELSPVEFFQVLTDILMSAPGVCTLLASSELHRGRMTPSMPDLSKYTLKELGPPPRTRAAANRMSPAGIVMFYASTDVDTAIAEMGAHSSNSYAVTGSFRPAKDLLVVDLTAIPNAPSIFDPDSADLIHGLQFLREFAADATLPVDLDGREHIDYVPTQVFTEYLHHAFPVRLDGLVFPSAQGEGNNVVLFCDASRCAEQGAENNRTILTFDPASVRGHRVKSVIASSQQV